MFNRSKMTRLLSLSLAVAGFILIGGHFSQADAQKRDPFETPTWKKSKPSPSQVNVTKDGKPQKPAKPAVMPVEAPPIEARINYYKSIREQAALNGMAIPKVTSVLTLNEMVVTGIFKTPRGFAAMVTATPIQLSYTIYPCEKFFDGQLVAIEENRLTFRKVIKMNNGKFISSVENKALREYSTKQQIQGTAPVENNSSKTEVVNNNETTQTTTTTNTAQTDDKSKTVTPSVIVSPVDEMNKQTLSKPEDADKDKNKKNKKPTKVAKKS